MQHFLEDDWQESFHGHLGDPIQHLLISYFLGFLKNSVYMVKIRNMTQKGERLLETIE